LPAIPLLSLRFLARLPLPLVHLVGGGLGLLSLLRAKQRHLIAANLRHAGLYSPAMVLRVGRELGKGVLELIPIWLRPLDEVTGWVREVRGWEHVEAALAKGHGMILLGPHLGCLELAGLTVAARLPITALYRRPRQEWAHELMQAGRNRGQAHMVEPNLKGVRALLTALKKNEAAWVLPDQRANKGEGLWLHFLARWAYMPSLPYRLLTSTGATPLLFHCERLAWGRGYRLVIDALPTLSDDMDTAGEQINTAMEALIRHLPAQYLWTYLIHRLYPGEITPDGEGR
jgi:KDO2-lipid IV(A) lauroyltransferase